MVTIAFFFEQLLQAIVWIVLLVLNFWVFQKEKKQGNVIMVAGAGCLAFASLIFAFSSWQSPPSEFIIFWLPLIGAAILTLGFYVLVKDLVASQIAAIKAKLTPATQEPKKPEGGGGGES